MEIETPQGTVLIDDEDAHLVEGRKVVVRPNPNNRNRDVTVGGHPLHRLIMKPGPGQDVDHKNRDPLDNRRENLRLCQRGQNLANRKGWGRYGYKGVTFHPERPGKGKAKWHARIGVNGRKIHLGAFDTLEEAARAYDKAALEHYGEFALINFPSDHD